MIAYLISKEGEVHTNWSFSTRGDWQCLETIWVGTDGAGVLLASSQDVVKCAEQFPE